MLGHNGGPELDDELDAGPLRIRVIRIHINDWRASTLGLTCEEEGFFWRFNLLLYDRMGVLSDDDQINSRSLSMDVRSYRRLKNRLISLGKIRIEDGCLNHPRIIREIEMYIAEYKRRSLAARLREKKRREEILSEVSSAEDRPNFRENSAGDRPEVGEKSGRLSPELNHHNSKSVNDFNGCDATTVAEADQSLTRARVPKPKPKPISKKESPLTPQGGDRGLLDAFEEFWKAFPGSPPPAGRKTDKPKALETFCAIVANKHRKGLKAKAEEIIAGAARYARTSPDPEFIPMPRTWLNGARWLDDADADAAAKAPWWRDPAKLAAMTPERWRNGIQQYANGIWPVEKLGPPPGNPQCVVPRVIVDELHLDEIYDDKGIKL